MKPPPVMVMTPPAGTRALPGSTLPIQAPPFTVMVPGWPTVGIATPPGPVNESMVMFATEVWPGLRPSDGTRSAVMRIG